MNSNKVVHILRYGTVAEKVHLEKAISSYDYLGINGNSAAFVSSAISKFIVERFFSKPDKGYFIDPITYAFQDKIDLLWTKSKTTGEDNLKKSIEKLIDAYGFPASKAISKQAITISDFTDESKKTFCKNVLSFQYNLVYDHINQNDMQKYLDYIAPEQSKNLPQLRPKFLIAPYFYIDPQSPEFCAWLKLNAEFLKMAADQAIKEFANIDIFAQIVLSKDVLVSKNIIDKIISEYKGIDCTGYTVWIDGFNEHEATEEELNGFIYLLSGIKSISSENRPIYNMYGGYFSILLTHKKISLLSGVSHGLEYGENRKVYPVGGGIPVSKYYYYPLHHRTDFTKAFYLLDFANIIDLKKEDWGTTDKYYSQICKCQQCQNVLGKEMINFMEFESKEFYEIKRKNQTLRRKKASSDTRQNCLYHYLLCKKIEFSTVAKSSWSSLIDSLKCTLEFYKNCEFINDEDIQYIWSWYNVLYQLK